MANLVTNVLQANLISTEDATSVVLVNRSVAPTMDGFVADGVYYAKTPDAAAHALNFPQGFTTILQFYIRNSKAAGSLLINVTPSGGAAADVALLGPGDVYIYWQNSTGSAAVGGVSQGYTAVSVTGSAAGITYEYFMGA